jgi:hypothetical protein
MRDLDRMIDEALDTEERELLRSIGEEPGYLRQAIGVFSGRTGWVNVVLMIVQGIAFLAGAWAAWHFFQDGRTGRTVALGISRRRAADPVCHHQDGGAAENRDQPHHPRTEADRATDRAQPRSLVRLGFGQHLAEAQRQIERFRMRGPEEQRPGDKALEAENEWVV